MPERRRIPVLGGEYWPGGRFSLRCWDDGADLFGEVVPAVRDVPTHLTKNSRMRPFYGKRRFMAEWDGMADTAFPEEPLFCSIWRGSRTNCLHAARHVVD